MHDFHTNYIRVKYGSGATWLFTDTGSLVYEIETDDTYKYFSKDKSLFYFSNYLKDSPFYDPVNKIVIGKMKGKVRENIIKDIIR